MSAVISFERARLADAEEMAPLMRAEEVAEVYAAFGDSPREALEVSIRISDARTARLDGKIVGIFGVMPINLLDGVVSPWLLTTGEVDKHPRPFLRACREVITEYRARYALMENMVDARYAKSLRWAKWLGFEVGAPEPYGFEGRDFCKITMKGG